jgi:hypothetical protein
MDWLTALGWVGSALLIFSLLQSRVLRFRLINLCASVVLTIFNALLEIWPMVAMNVVLAGINLFFLRRLLSERHDDKAFEVVQVNPDDEYLRHVLRVHGSDILKYQPNFVWDGAAGGQNAYLILHGDETVGVVLVRDGGGGVAHVLLDYVTPRFRDFSPGEFVWRKSGLLRDCGFSKVVTPAGMVAPYYEDVGFHQEGEVYTLDL